MLRGYGGNGGNANDADEVNNDVSRVHSTGVIEGEGMSPYPKKSR